MIVTIKIGGESFAFPAESHGAYEAFEFCMTALKHAVGYCTAEISLLDPDAPVAYTNALEEAADEE